MYHVYPIISVISFHQHQHQHHHHHHPAVRSPPLSSLILSPSALSPQASGVIPQLSALGPQPSARSPALNPDYRFWNWVDTLLCKLPDRCVPIMLMDGNCHFGVVHSGQDQYTMPDGDAIGRRGAEKEDWSGQRVRALLNRHLLCAVNTHHHSGYGATYWKNEAATRADYICLPKSPLDRVTQVMVWRRAGRELQLSPAPRNVDHAPLMVEFLMHCWHESDTEVLFKWDGDALMFAWLKGGEK